jgi:HlyD family secretion protein
VKGAKLYIILGSIVAGIIALSIAGKKGLLGNKKGTKVAIDTIKNRSIVESVSSSGKIFPVKEVKVSPQATGIVKQLLVHEGQYVRKGDIIAKVEQSASSSPISLEGLLPMQGGGVTPPTNNKPKSVNIYAPSSGIITRLNIREGESVMGAAQMGGAEMLVISDMSKMKVDIEIGENDIQKIAIGDTAIIEVDAYQRKKFRGFVSKIAQSNTSTSIMANAMSSDQISNYTVSVEISQDTYQDIIDKNKKFPFRPGMSAQVEILTEHHNNVVAVPIVAVTARDLDSLNMNR